MKSNAKKRYPISKTIGVAMFALIAFVNLIPFVWGAITSIKPIREVLRYPPAIFDFAPSMEHYERVFANGFLRNAGNSLLYCLAAMAGCVVLGLLAAYAMQRYNFKGKKIIFFVIVCGIPLASGSAALVIPNYVFFSSFNFIDKWYTLPVLYIAYNLAMSIWILMSGIESIPIEIEEAAMIDGASRPYILFRMIPRLCLPSIAAAMLFAFIGAWNEYIVSSVLVNTPSLYPVQIAIYQFLGFFGQEWGPLTAAATVAVIPTLIVFSFLGKWLISGLTSGAVKG